MKNWMRDRRKKLLASRYMAANSNPEGHNQYTGASGVASAYHGAKDLTDEQHAKAHAAADKLTSGEAQDALKQMGFIPRQSGSRQQHVDMIKQMITSRRGATQRVKAAGRGHPLF